MGDQKNFISGIVPPKEQTQSAWWFAFLENKLLVYEKSPSVETPCLVHFDELGLNVLRQNYLGQLDGRECYAVELPEGSTAPAGMAFEGLRKVYGRLDEDLF